jgi:hypothetical protein
MGKAQGLSQRNGENEMEPSRELNPPLDKFAEKAASPHHASRTHHNSLLCRAALYHQNFIAHV